LPGDEGSTGKKCGKSAETIAGNSSLSEGLFTARAEWSFSQWQNSMKMISSERARRDEDVGFGIS
jgi:hypothetical protein